MRIATLKSSRGSKPKARRDSARARKKRRQSEGVAVSHVEDAQAAAGESVLFNVTPPLLTESASMPPTPTTRCSSLLQRLPVALPVVLVVVVAALVGVVVVVVAAIFVVGVKWQQQKRYQ